MNVSISSICLQPAEANDYREACVPTLCSDMLRGQWEYLVQLDTLEVKGSTCWEYLGLRTSTSLKNHREIASYENSCLYIVAFFLSSHPATNLKYHAYRPIKFREYRREADSCGTRGNNCYSENEFYWMALCATWNEVQRAAGGWGIGSDQSKWCDYAT